MLVHLTEPARFARLGAQYACPFRLAQAAIGVAGLPRLPSGALAAIDAIERVE